MDFILSNQNQPPVIDPSGAINLQDWRVSGSLQATPRYPIKLQSGQVLELSESPEPPTKELQSVTDEELLWIREQGNFPIVNALCFVRGLVHDVDSIAPMLSIGSFFAEYSDAIKKLVEKNLRTKAPKGAEWVEYYASSLQLFPIFSTIFNLLALKHRTAIGESYFDQFTDVKYLDPSRISTLSIEEKVGVLRDVLTKHQGNDGKLQTAINLFTAEDVIPNSDAITILNATRSSTDAGRLMTCLGFIRDYTNAYNVVATWIRHCLAEKIGTNQSVWYNAATDLEVQHNFSLAGEYVKNLRGTPIGLNYTTTPMGGVNGGFRSTYANNTPMGM